MKYIAFDGEIFNTAEECQKHEKTISFIMYDNNGVTKSSHFAISVLIMNYKGLEDFSALCKKEGSICEGIVSPGRWVWSSFGERYFRLDEKTFDSIVYMESDYNSINN